METNTLHSLMFKETVSYTTNYLYLSLIIAAIGIFIYLWLQYRKSSPAIEKLKILEQKQIHNKSRIYLVDYEGQQFLLADNHQALSWHTVKIPGKSS